MPDTYLVQHGFVDQSTGQAYYPSDYPDHGSGLYFAALENDGKLYAYALNADGTFHRVAVVDTGMGHVMDVQYDADLQRIWALCDNTCSVTSTVLKVDTTGAIVPDVRVRPADATAGLPNVNIEGFAIAPNSTCVDGVKEDGLVRRRHLGHRSRGSRAVPRHVPVRSRPRRTGRAHGDRPGRSRPWRRERGQEGHAARARVGLRAG